MVKILDFHHQANRLFGRFLDINDYRDSANGVYDVIIAHRQIEEDGEIEELIKYCKKNYKNNSRYNNRIWSNRTFY